MKATISDAINSLSPNSQYIISNNEYDQITWLEPPVYEGGKKKPSKQQVEEEIKKIQKNYDDTEYQRLRAPEYPDIKDYLDGIVKGDTEQMQAYIDKCLAVKAKYPKSEVTEE
jgi:hypothetical protein